MEDEIKKVVWDTIKGKIVFILLGSIGVIVADLLVRAIPNILKAVAGVN